MNNLRKLRILSILLALAITVVAVGSRIAPARASSTAVSHADAGSIRVAFIPQLIGIPYFTAMQQGGNAAARRFGVKFLYDGSTQANAPDQVRIMQNLIQQHVNAICVSVLDSASINPIIRQARSKGIAVCTSDSDSPNSARQVFVAQALDQDLGYTLIDRLAMQIGSAGQIGIVSGESTATNLDTWIRYMKQRVASKYPKIKIVDVRYTHGGSSQDALNQAQDLMTRYPGIKGLIAVASTTVPGVAQAVQQAGKAGKVAVIGYGSPNTVRPYVHSGVMKESILWNPRDLGYLTVWAEKQLVMHKGFKSTNHVPGMHAVRYFPGKHILLLGKPLVINKANVDKFNF